MAISKSRKDELVEQYMQLIENSRAVLLTEYTGLTVKQMQELRSDVRKADGAFHVTKNTLLIHALRESGKPIPEELFSGQVASGFALAEVPSLAKALVDFAKASELLQIKGGILGDKILTREEVEALAKLPSLEELRAQLLGLIQAPARNIASTVAGGVRQLVNVVDAYSKKESQAEASA